MGAHQRELPIEGDAADSVLRVNDLLSFKKLQQRLDEGVRTVTILGAGLIGSEFADDLSRAGYEVNVVDPGGRALAGLLPGVMATELQQRLEAKGVVWHFGVTLQRLQAEADGYLAQLSDGSAFNTDLVLSAAGLVANTALAQKSGLQVDSGIAVNSDMRTSNSDIYAVGDCASVDGRLFAYIEPIRRQAEAIAADLMGEHERFMPIPPMVKIKTQSMPMSVCRPAGNLDDAAWQFVSNDEDGCHFQVLDDVNVIGFALSDALASDAGSHYRKLSVS
jgi:rubredoxin-NAD+ reductase